MTAFRRKVALILIAIATIGIGRARAQSPRPSAQTHPSPQQEQLEIPPGLPRYALDIRIEPAERKVYARETVEFTNRSKVSTNELVFHVYPRYRVADGDRLILSKTLEMLRLSPEEAMDTVGRRMELSRVSVGNRAVGSSFDKDVDSILIVPLPSPLPPGGTVRVGIDFVLDLPDKWGRWGQHDGITYLVNWYPVLAHHDDKGWDKTPFIPWHQPFYQDAGHYTVRADLPAGQVIASTGRITREEHEVRERKRVTITANPARDFALVCSDRFQIWESKAGNTPVRVVALPEHEQNARTALDTACEVIPIYEQQFGPYPMEEFEVAASFFGWNGNECSGLVLLDDRVLRLPSSGARYIDHLVTHETCHQWWWNCVGTDGYGETFMDEGLVNSFTALRLDEKYGRNAPLITWQQGLTWLPTIGREDLRLSGYYGWRAKGNNGPVVQDLKKMGNLGALFSLAYDRGGKTVEMMRNRLGDRRFWDFWRTVYRKYAWKTFYYADLRRELIAFDPQGGWDKFLDGWIDEHKDTDWSIEHVRVKPTSEPGVKNVSIELKQSGQMVEPTIVLCRSDEGEVRVPIWPERGDYEVPGGHVSRQGDDRWIVQVVAPDTPKQVEVDPDHALLDARPDNNRWKPEISARFTPFMTPIDQSSQFQAYDRVSLVTGPFIDQYARGGYKAAIQRAESWQISGWAGTEPALREIIFGGQATLFHVPWPSWSAGVFYEQGLYNWYNDKRHSGGRAFLRYRFLENSSFLVDDMGFVEAYLGVGNEFWAGDDGRPVNGSLTALGVRYRLNTQSPYWDPVSGYAIDTSVEHGDTAFGSSRDYTRMAFQYAFVRPVLPDGTTYLSSTRIAMRAYGGMAFPDNAPYFRLGGGQRLRALDLSQNLGSSVWLYSIEWRFPLWSNIDKDFLDHVVGWKNLYGALFYDVGQSYLLGKWSPVVHGVGVGLHFDVSLFAFLERASLRVDLAQPIGIGLSRGPVIWFGLNQAF
jgi:hypothetical protein